jgi:predicted RecB family nuclease
MSGLQCPKRLWLSTYQPLPQEDPEPGSAIDIGNRIGRLARTLHPKGILVEEDHQNPAGAVRRTKSLMKNPKVPAIFEATFAARDLLARVDILERGGRGRWNLREVKGSTKVKDEYKADVAFQLLVLESAGVNVGLVELLHVDDEYVRGKKGLEPGKLFKAADLTIEAKARRPEIESAVAEARTVLGLEMAPKVEPSGHCHSPYTCEFWETCTARKPVDWTFYLLGRGKKNRKVAELARKGIHSIGKIPDNFDLTANQAVMRDAHRSGRPHVSPRLRDALRPAAPPTLYLDFETLGAPIPLYEGTRPYQILPFQWSLHRQSRQGSLIHDAHLGGGKSDPRKAFGESLIDALAGDDVPIIVYSDFERQVLSSLKSVMASKQAKAIDQIIDRLVDMLAIVKGHVYHPGFLCSFSIKNVAPVLAPGISYKSLPLVADGTAASATFERIAAGRLMPGEDEAALRSALLEYCKLDTLAMVEVHRALMKMAG